MEDTREQDILQVTLAMVRDNKSGDVNWDPVLVAEVGESRLIWWVKQVAAEGMLECFRRRVPRVERDVDICFLAFSNSGGTVTGKLAAGYRILEDRKECGFVVAAGEKAVVELFDGNSAVAEFGGEAEDPDDHPNYKTSEDTRRVSRVRRQVEV